MAETNEYVITLKNNSELQDELSPGALSSPEQKTAKTDGAISSDNSAVKNVMKQLFGYAAIKSTVDQAVGYEVSTIQLKTGRNELQERASFGYNVANKVIGMGTALAMGAMTGNLALVAVGLAISATHSAISYAQKANTLRTEEKNETISRNIKAQRSTVSGSRYMSAADM